MKTRILIILVMCIIFAGCTNTRNQPGQPAQTAPVETKATEAATVIRPLPDTTMDALENSIVNISFEQNGFYRDEAGNVYLQMQIYSYDKFDMVDISAMKVGDIILISGEELIVNSVERNDQGTVFINGGLDEGGLDMITDDGGIYFSHGYSDMKSWNLVGEANCPVSDDFVFTDSVNLDLGKVIYGAEDLLNSIPAPEYGYQPQNTTVRIENGQVVTMERIYTP